MENGREIMNFIVTFSEKEKSKYMTDEKDIFLTFQKVTCNKKKDLLDVITHKAFRVIMSCEWMQKVRWVKMEMENGITCMCE